MKFDQDFKEFIELLNEHHVEYLVVGGYAVVFHGYARFTGDIDFWIKPSPENAERVLKVLKDFGFGGLGVKKEDLSKPDRIHQFGYHPVRIDLITSVEGLDFDNCFRRKKTKKASGVKINFLSLEDLVKNKRLVGRPRDLEDFQQLKRKRK